MPASTDNTAVHERTGKSGEEKEKQCPRLKNESASDRREILSLRPSWETLVNRVGPWKWIERPREEKHLGKSYYTER